MRVHEIIEVKLERLPDHSIKVSAINRGTGRVLFDPIYVQSSGIQAFRIVVTPLGLCYELDGAGYGSLTGMQPDDFNDIWRCGRDIKW